MVTLKDRDDDLSGTAHEIARVLRRAFGDRCLSVMVEDHNEQLLAHGSEY
jgi:hypothetical protein